MSVHGRISPELRTIDDLPKASSLFVTFLPYSDRIGPITGRGLALQAIKLQLDRFCEPLTSGLMSPSHV
jgi:hypothetical protein